ncbi:tRNA-binding domain and Aminoacyl-tRNA synthetase, class 1a, anticodon-binding domain and Nucleic acid-binding, OB-fold domain and Rossmann-like alpha/beta/alpha sandwich fold domain and Methionyl-tRNA synthetase family and Methionyl/Leucyl tRNA synthetase family and Methionine-tRNA ligase, type 1 family-containing protein [Strongyloides ratti]|uniref:Methionine--tRNA ligase, cytoplasmic n=1 Tax=Strongyloides ratti TaxID=34506 RepID=A0A090KWI1_STRRB|nr:tRNA-binding domain and Aminoacyl-tRNA synthetase, class 1a, anticodon-binding domain and Nucleic acid-binding, OB-fold domain and Rossmann-like alpha/beta/alpha sandwich fold domain and Methionyl-tRNA synthetase family and Methionyl/Leucyl tRNA synthetase family and Methionine-tRNA ligase, type 1 family-containing protein [Strongyloides ratti]CEF61766.1 tRNA-binding domain and Aminoacyl-tRNA synthetase, class 1a, anticodon-binding domain and Nucleic acid-binding, OB-fold domain and Rossmann-li
MESIEKTFFSEPTFYHDTVTSALPYVNNVPHLGNIIGCVLSADVFVRFCNITGINCLYISGTDEYGTATEVKALQEKMSPSEICSKYHEIHKKIYDWFNIKFDAFGRTSTEAQTEITQDVFNKLYANGFIESQDVDQLHCSSCNIFLADRYVNGICPLCTYDDARGDQCDGCGKLINAIELKEPKCLLCKKTPSLKKSKHLFLCLDKLTTDVYENLENILKNENNHWSSNAISIAKSWLKTGLEKRCITRDLKWGVKVPIEGFQDKVFYVWFDAPIGYISITKQLLGDDYVKWWKNSKDVELYNFLGKDNVAFHSIMFPATLFGTKDNYTIVKHINATEYFNYEDQKFSKSRGIGVFGDAASETGIPADVWRFYLLYMRPESSDTYFSWDDFANKINSELLSNLGNFCNRSLSFLSKNYNGIIPNIIVNDEDKELFIGINKDLEEYHKCLTEVKLRDGLLKILSISRKGNQYLQNNAPWKLIKGNDEEKHRAETVIGISANLVYLLSVVLYPYMPKVSEEIRKQCNKDELTMLPKNICCVLKSGHKIGTPATLFTKLESEDIALFKAKFGTSSKTETKVDKKPDNKKDQKKKPQDSNKKMETKIIESNFFYPKAQANIKNIDNVMASLKESTEKAKSLFEKEQLIKLSEDKKKLSVEIEKLLKQLKEEEIKGGIKQIDVPINVNETMNLLEESNIKKEEIVIEKKKKESVLLKNEKKEKSTKGSEKTSNLSDDSVDIGRLDLRVGKIIECKRHPDADALYLETIDLGEEKPRTVISGLVKFVPIEEMQNRLVICLCNLKPAKMRGIESQAMVMCASTPEKVEIMEVDPSCTPGMRITCGSFVSRPDSVLNPKKKVWEQVAPDLKVNNEGKATYKGELLLVNSQTFVVAPTLRDVNIK